MCKKTIFNQLKNVVKHIPDPIKSTQKVSDAAKRIHEENKQNVSEIWGKAKEQLNETSKVLKEKSDQVKTSINEKTDEISENLLQKSSEIGKKLNENVSDLANSAKNKTSDTIRNVGKATGDTFNSAFDKSQEIGKSVRKTTENILKEAQERSSKIGSETSKAINQTLKETSDKTLKEGKILYEKTKNSPVVEKIVENVKEQQKGLLKKMYWRFLFGIGFIVAIYGFSSSIPKEIRKYVSEKPAKEEKEIK